MQPASPPCTTMPRHGLTIAMLIAGWLVVLAMGWLAMTTYGFKRETATFVEPPRHWPSDSQLPRIDGVSSLLVFLHPKCPCSQATVAELERLFDSYRAGKKRPLQLCIAATIPRSADQSWADTSLIRRGLQLGGAQLFVDRGGVEATRFAVAVSGTVMLFDEAGSLCYAGGVTMARGHEGDNVGRESLRRLLMGEQGAANAIPAFGCRLVLEDLHGADDETGPTTIDTCCDQKHCTLNKLVEAPQRGDDR